MAILLTNEEKVRHIAESLRRKARAFAERLAPVYRVLEWRWHDKKVAPTAVDIGNSFMRHIDSVELMVLNSLKKNPESTGGWERSGGLCVGIERERDDEGGLDSWEGTIQFWDHEAAYEWDVLPPVAQPG